MNAEPTASEIEREAATDEFVQPAHVPVVHAPEGTALTMLVRRGFSPSLSPLDVPFDPHLPLAQLEAIETALHHYAFRLFLRGAILRRGAFDPGEASRFLSVNAAQHAAQQLVDLGIATRDSAGLLELKHSARSFGGTLEWYVAQGLRRRWGLDAIAGVKFHAAGVGGDLDVVAAADGVLTCLELKSSPPKHLKGEEVGAFFERVRTLRPHIAIFAMDTALRLEDKVVPLLLESLPNGVQPRRVIREVWALSPNLYAVNARPDLLSNIGVALAEGTRALGPSFLGL